MSRIHGHSANGDPEATTLPPDWAARDAARVFATVAGVYIPATLPRVEVELGACRILKYVRRWLFVGDLMRRSGALHTISEAVPQAGEMRLGVGYEFEERPDGLRGLEAAYGLKFVGDPRTMDLGLLYRALTSNQVDIVAGSSTDGPIRALGLVALEDDEPLLSALMRRCRWCEKTP